MNLSSKYTAIKYLNNLQKKKKIKAKNILLKPE